MTEKIKVPFSLKYMILHSDEKLKNLQRELLENFSIANEETMKLLNISPEDGWILDASSMHYVRQTETKVEDAPISE